MPPASAPLPASPAAPGRLSTRLGLGLAMALTALALVLPTLVVQWVVVGYAVFAQTVSVFCWGLALTAWAALDRGTRTPWAALAPLWWALGLTALGVAATALRVPHPLPGPLVGALGVLATAALAAGTAARLAQGRHAAAAARAFACGLVLAATLASGLAVVQLFVPQWVDGVWVARPLGNGRAFANLLQPNHLATLCALGLAAALWARLAGWLARPAWWALTLLLPATVAMSASRAGLAELALMAVWAALARGLPREVRVAWGLAPLVCAALMLVLPWLVPPGPALAGGLPAAPAAVVGTEVLRPTLRAEIFAGAWALIRESPWFGVGWDELGTAWALSPQVNGLGRAFTHVHNLQLQLAAELGVPMAIVISAAMVAMGLRVWRQGRDLPTRAAVPMLLAVGMHSQVEFPLWYAFFLVPLCWAVGCSAASGVPAARVPAGATLLRVPVGAAVSVAALAAFADLVRVLPATLPIAHPLPVPERIAQAQPSVLYRHVRDAAALLLPGPVPLSVIAGARHVAVNGDVLQAWARALEKSGQHDAALHVSQRARAYAAAMPNSPPIPCQEAAAEGRGLPCGIPVRPVDWRTLR